MTIDLSGLPRHVTLAVGGALEFPLPSYADSGNVWSATCVRGEGVAHVSVELGEVPASVDPARRRYRRAPVRSCSSRRRAVVRGLASGEATWRLVLSRRFDPSRPAATHDFDVTVVAAS